MIKGRIPESREITALQAEKYLQKAEECIKFGRLDHLKKIIELKLANGEENQVNIKIPDKAEEIEAAIKGSVSSMADVKEAAGSGLGLLDLAAALLKMHIGEETTDINIEDKIYEYRGDERRSGQGRNGHEKDGYSRTGYGRGSYGRDDYGKGGYKKSGYTNYSSTKSRGKIDAKDAEKRNRDKVTADRNGKSYKSTKKLGRK